MCCDKLCGLIAAPFTPFTGNDEVNYEMIDCQAEKLIKDGVIGAYICGTTGEGILCTIEERMKIAERWQSAVGGRLKIIVHTGAYSMKDVHTLSRHAVAVGADGFSVIPHGFFKPGSVGDLVNYCAAAAACAPELPFYYYNTMNAGLNISMSAFLREAAGKIPNLGGIKFYSYDFFEYQKCLEFADRKFDIVYGADEVFNAALACGAKGFIGSTYNYIPEIYRQVEKDFFAGNHEAVQREMRKVRKIVDLLIQYGGIAVGKLLMQLKDLDCGDVRAPLAPLSDALKKEILAKAKDILAS